MSKKDIRQIFKCVALALCSLFTLFAVAGYVRGYYRRNGTYVAPYYRADRGSSKQYTPAATYTPPPRVRAHTPAITVETTTPKPQVKTTTPKSYSVWKQRQIQGPRRFSRRMKVQKYIEQGARCPHCQGIFDFSEMQGDHILPYSKGGTTEYSNLQMLCAPCNKKKGNKGAY